MISKIKSIILHPFFTSSAVMVFGSNFANFLAFVYHLIIGRLLGPVHYGELAAVISLITMFSAVFTFLSTVAIKFASSANDKREEDYILSWFTRRTFWISTFLFIVTLLLSPFLSSFLHLDLKIILIVPFYLFFSLFSLVFRAFLQGVLKFNQSVISQNIELFLRLTLGVFFVYLGFSVFGAVLGIVISGTIGTFITYYFLRKYKLFINKDKFDFNKNIIKYALPVFVFSLTTTSFLTVDTLLAKHFINAHDAGIYASLSNLGKIILYGTVPIGAVMFPMVSKRFSKGQKYLSIFIFSLLLTFAVSMSVVALYQFFPDIAIKILYGGSYLEGGKYLIWFGLFASFYSLSSLICSFYLSISKVNVVFFPLFFSIFQIVGIFLVHNSILSIINVSLISATLMLVSLLIYLVYENHNREKVNFSGNSIL